MSISSNMATLSYYRLNRMFQSGIEIKMEITELQKEDEKAWDEYVFKSEHSTFYHQTGWRNVVEKTIQTDLFLSFV